MDTERKVLEQALRKAFDFGQTYWDQAESYSLSENAKSDATRQKFEALITETLATIDHPAVLQDAPYRCINPQCPNDCAMCNHAIPSSDAALVLIADMLNEMAVDGMGSPLEDGESQIVDRARKFLAVRRAIDHHLKGEPELCMCKDRQKSECPGEWEPRRENRSRGAQAEVESERVRWMSSDGPLTTAMDNVLASRMGTACQAAMSMSAGDLIDRGLGLLLKLNESGFDVTYRAEPAAQTKDSKQ